MAMDTKLKSVQVEIRHEELFACGCTTTRIESRNLEVAGIRHCAGHGGELEKIVVTTEYKHNLVSARRLPSLLSKPLNL